MKKTWRFLLRRSLPANSLAHLRFSVFGLGDSTYPKFNFVAKKLFKRLLSLGAQPLLPIGLADDQHPLGVDGALAPWMETLLTSLEPVFPAQFAQQPIPSTTLLPAVAPVVVADNQEPASSAALNERPHSQDEPSRKAPARVTLKQNTRLTPASHFQDVRCVCEGI